MDNVADGWSFTWDLTNVADGSHTLMAVATNGAAQTGSADVTITVDNLPDPILLPISVENLDGSSTLVNKNSWKATVVVTINPALAGAVVAGEWGNGTAATCTTDTLGQCTVTISMSTKASSITFDVTNITLAGYEFTPGANDTVTVNKPQ